MTDLTNKQKAHLRVDFFLADGVTVATVASIPEWEVDNEAVATVGNISADGHEIDLLPTAAGGTVVVTARANADLTGGSRFVQAQESFLVTVVLDEAQSAKITVTSISPQ